MARFLAGIPRVRNIDISVSEIMRAMRIEKPWGYEELIYVGENYLLKKLFMKKGQRCSLQYHKIKHETVYVLEGKIELFHNGKNIVLLPNEHAIIAPGEIHRMTGLEDSIYLEASTPELEDVVRIQDDFGR